MRHKNDALTDNLLHTAVVAVGILEPQTHFGSVFLEVKKLFGVEGSTSLPMNSRGKRLKQCSQENTILNILLLLVW